MLTSYDSPSQPVDFSCLGDLNFSNMTPSQLTTMFQQLRQQRDDVLSMVFYLTKAIKQCVNDEAQSYLEQADLNELQRLHSALGAAANGQQLLDTLHTLVLPNITEKDQLTLAQFTDLTKDANQNEPALLARAANVQQYATLTISLTPTLIETPIYHNQAHELGTPLHVAARLGDLREVNRLLAVGVAVNAQFGPLRLTALMIAAHMGHADIVKSLLDKGAYDFLQSEDGRYALDWSFAPQSNPLTSTLLFSTLQKSVTPNYWRVCKEERLCWAARTGDISATRWLLQQGAGRGKHLPLAHAIQARHTHVVQLLLQHGDVHGPKDDPENAFYPLHLAIAHFAPVKILQMLVSAGADIHKPHPTHGPVKKFMKSESHTSAHKAIAARLRKESEIETSATALATVLFKNSIKSLLYFNHASDIASIKQFVIILKGSRKEDLAKRLLNTTELNSSAALQQLLNVTAQICDFELTSRRSFSISDFQAMMVSFFGYQSKSEDDDKEENVFRNLLSEREKKPTEIFSGRKILSILTTKYTDNESLNQQFRMALIKLILIMEFKRLRAEYKPRSFFEGPVSEPDWLPTRLEENDIPALKHWESYLSAPQFTNQAVLQLLMTAHKHGSIGQHINAEGRNPLLINPRQIPLDSVVEEEQQHDQLNNPRVQYLFLLKMLMFNRCAHPETRGFLCLVPLDVLSVIFGIVNQKTGEVIPDIYLDRVSVLERRQARQANLQPVYQRYQLRRKIRDAIGATTIDATGKQQSDIAKLIKWMAATTVHPYKLLTAPLSCQDGSQYQQLITMALHGTTGEKTHLVREVLFLLNKGLEKSVMPDQALQTELQQSQQAAQLLAPQQAEQVTPLLPPDAKVEPAQAPAVIEHAPQVSQPSAATEPTPQLLQPSTVSVQTQEPSTATNQAPQLTDPALAEEVASIRSMLAVLAPSTVKSKTPTPTSLLDLVVYINSVMRNSDSEKIKQCISYEFHKTPLELTAFLDRILADLSEPQPSMSLNV
jgi:ankyrin repeat protein